MEYVRLRTIEVNEWLILYVGLLFINFEFVFLPKLLSYLFLIYTLGIFDICNWKKSYLLQPMVVGNFTECILNAGIYTVGLAQWNPHYGNYKV